MKGFILLLALFFALPFANALIFSEVMYDLSGSDTGREWIELYNDGDSLNLSGWKLYEAGTNHGLTLINGGLSLAHGDYAVIVSDPDKFYLDNPSFIGNLIDSSFSLANTNETIAMKNSSLNITAELTYLSSWGGNGNNRSVQLKDGSWCEGIPTPGAANSCSSPLEEEEENNSESVSQNNTIPTNNSSSNNSFSNSSQSTCNGLNITLSDHPSEMRFGDSGKVRIDANLTCYEKSSITFLVYGSSSRVISKENGSKITSYASCQNGKEISIEKREYSWDIDFFSYPNCDNGYKEGNYSVSVRGCDSSGDKIYEEDFAINLSGTNSSRCGSELSVEEESSAAETGSNDTAEEKSLEPLMKITSKTPSKDSSSSNTGVELVYGTKNSFERKVALCLVGMLSALLLIYLLREGKI